MEKSKYFDERFQHQLHKYNKNTCPGPLMVLKMDNFLVFHAVSVKWGDLYKKKTRAVVTNTAGFLANTI